MSVTTLGTGEFEKKILRKKVVVVGAGLAGALVAKKLEEHAEVFLIDAKDFFEVPTATRRCITEPALAARACFLHSDYLQKPTLVTNSARNATRTAVTTDHGEHIEFDFLVIATDNTYKNSLTREGRIEEFHKDNKKLQAAKHVVIVGGGPSGVELAAEVVTNFPDVKLTLVHAGTRLLEHIHPSASKKALAWLQGRGVEVILDDKVENVKGPPYATAKGTKIPADVHFLCCGKAVGSPWLRESEFKDALDEQGRLKVDDTLRVPGFHNVFGVGDLTAIKEMKKGHYAEAHANVCIQNIKKLIKDPKCKQLKKYSTSKCLVAVVPLGRYSAIYQSPCCLCSGRVAAICQCSDLGVSRTRRLLGLK